MIFSSSIRSVSTRLKENRVPFLGFLYSIPEAISSGTVTLDHGVSPWPAGAAPLPDLGGITPGAGAVPREPVVDRAPVDGLAALTFASISALLSSLAFRLSSRALSKSGEAARLLRCTTSRIQADRLSAARDLSRRSGAAGERCESLAIPIDCRYRLFGVTPQIALFPFPRVSSRLSISRIHICIVCPLLGTALA